MLSAKIIQIWELEVKGFPVRKAPFKINTMYMFTQIQHWISFTINIL